MYRCFCKANLTCDLASSEAEFSEDYKKKWNFILNKMYTAYYKKSTCNIYIS